MFSMKPEPSDYSIKIPLTFDYSGGRSENSRGNILLTIVICVISVLLVVGIFLNDDTPLYKKLILSSVVLVVVTTFLRFSVFKEAIFSDIFESLKEVDFMPDASCFWKIYDINIDYPYVCHYTNGMKGIFVRMEKDVIVGKSDTVMYDHFEGISEAYNRASSMNINMVHIDYMDNVGNDPRLKSMYEDLKDVVNPDMQEVMNDIYQNLEYEMSRDYSSFDVYVFFSRDHLESFVYNVQAICTEMIGGNFLSYKVLDTNGLRKLCMSLFNLNDFSVINSSESLLKNSSHAGIVPISVEHGDGTIEKINKTVEEKRLEAEERLRREQAEKAAQKNKKKKQQVNNKEDDDEEINLF